MTILVTGANGKIGKKLITYLKNNTGHSILCYSAEQNELPFADAIIHLAGLTHSHKPKEYFQVNTELTKKLLQQAEEKKIKKFIFISSCAANEEGGEYAQSKLAAEKEVKKYSQSWLILRLSEVYGNESFHGLEKIIKQAKKYHLTVLPMQKFFTCPVHIEDLLPAFVSTLDENIKNKTYQLAGPETYSSQELIEIIKEKIQKNFLTIYLPLFVFRALALLAQLTKQKFIYTDQIPRLYSKKNYNIRDASRDLKFHPRTLN